MISLYVLYVDDEPDIREIIDLSLGLDPLFVPRGCGSGDEALALATEWRPDMILLDVTMPVMDGPAILDRLRANRETARIPILFMTAHAQTRDCQRFIALGAAGVIAKPFDPVALASLVRGYVPMETRLAPLRDTFLRRVTADAAALLACRSQLGQESLARAALARIKDIAHSLSGASGIYGFAGISCESAALEDATDGVLAGAGRAKLDLALDRLLARMVVQDIKSESTQASDRRSARA